MFVAQTTTRQPPTTTRQQGRLPVEATGFIGRRAELARLGGLLERARLVTVTGPGGVGKTRVALRAAAQAASRFRDGACLVELAALGQPELLAHAVADALGLAVPSAQAPAGQAPAAPASADVRQNAVLAHLRDRHLLLILDNCEHLIDECAVFAEAVIAEAPGVTLLATSREPLDVIGENSCPLPPLPITDPDDRDCDDHGGTAADLFLQRAAAAVPGFTATPEDRRLVIALCRRLDGLPLAIEFAAVRLRALSLAELASRLDERLVLLAGSQRGGRHKTLRDAIAWSYDLCTPAEQALWARLSVFSGPVSISAAEQVCPGDEIGPGQVLATMIRLVDKSVLGRAEPDDDDDGRADAGADGIARSQPTRYRMLDTLREFGRERLAAEGELTAVRGRLLARYLTMARDLRDRFADDDQLDRLRELRREHASIVAVLECALGSGPGPGYGPGPGADVADGVELAIALFTYWCARGLTAEGGRWLARAVECAPDGSAARARALLARGHLAALRGDGALADADSARALAIAAGLGHDVIIAHAHLVRNLALSVSGQLAEAAAAGAEAGRRLAALDARTGLIGLEIQLGYLALLSNDVPAAIDHVRQGLDLLGHGHERWLHGRLYLLAAMALFLAGREVESGLGALRSLRAKHDLGDDPGVACALEILGWLATRAGRHGRAAWLLGAADRLWSQSGGRLVAHGALERWHAEAVARSTAALGGRRFEAIAARAAARSTEEVIAFADSDADSLDAPDDASGPGPRLPGPLTAREHEIALLVADGLSNRSVAEQLFISRRTVDAHVEHIFDKLGITSRVTLAIRLRDQPVAAWRGGRG